MLNLKRILLITGVLFAQWGWSQTDLPVQGTSPDLYITHTVDAKETWYSIGRLYNASPKEIATLNGMKMDKLNVGDQLKIPLTSANFSQDGKKKNDEVFIPVTHTVADKEWMYRISQNYNKIPIETLEKWNGVTNDQLKAGMKLTVGYLKVNGQSKLAAGGFKKLPAASVAKKEELKTEEPKKETVAVTAPAVPAVTETPKTEAPKTEAGKADPAKIETAKSEASKSQVKTVSTPVENSTEGTYSGYKGGFFKSGYTGIGKSTAGNAGVFRSTSGWKDGKYYALMNNVPVGTILKVTYTSSNKTVFAKVLGQLPDMKESTGLTLRLNDAAAAELGAEMGKFYVDVSY